MKNSILVALLSTALLMPGPPAPNQRVRINDNRHAAGVLRNGVLTLRLEARVATWHPDADDGPGVDVQAFAEEGAPPEIPGPLIRVPAGTVVELTMRNAVPSSTLVVHGLSRDSIRIPTGEKQQLRFRLDTPGTYYYWGTTSGRRLGVRIHEDAQLTGAIVVDDSLQSRGKSPPHDRVFVIGMMGDTTGGENIRADRDHLLFVINGRSWPHTERLSYSMGDTIRWRVLNTTVDPHPMHLHGTYFRVESHGDGAVDTKFAADQRDLVNTEFMPPAATMTMSWSPEHSGNWLFHCHIPEHFGARGPLGVLRASNHEAMRTVGNHAIEGMSGLVMGITVQARKIPEPVTDDSQRRRLRLLVRTNLGSTSVYPYYGYKLHETGTEPALDSGFHAGPPIILARGQPVAIMVVNRTDAPTAVHWHGIELDSYFDGVAGFSGIEKRLTPIVAPGDSFEARFTPPRAGTFMYHTHIDEGRQQRAGLAGILLVLEPGHAFDPARDVPILISSPSDSASEAHRVLINGSLAPAPVNLRSGVSYRLRFANITTGRPGMHIDMLRDSVLATWTPIAKDGADLPKARRVMRPARQRISIGETMDFEVTPGLPGVMRLEMLTVSGKSLGTLAMRVR